MINRLFLLGALAILLNCCVDESTTNNIRGSTKYGKCGSLQLEKLSADSVRTLKYDSLGTVQFMSADSLQVSFVADVSCTLDHSEKYSLENDSTLKVDWVYASSTRGAGCACREIVTVSITSKEIILQNIKKIDFNGLPVKI